MSIEAVRGVLERSKAKQSQRHILLVLAEHANENWEAWPSLETIAAEANISERMARYALRKLESSGEIQVSKRGGGRSNSTVYRLTLPERGQPMVEKGAMGCPVSSQERGQYPSERGQPMVEKGAMGCPRTVRNHQEPPDTPQSPRGGEDGIEKQKAEAKRRAEAKAREATEQETFAAFWQAYPKKVSKADAEKAWRKHKCADHLAAILTALERGRQSQDWQREDSRFIPYPSTWLNGHRWTDEGVERLSAASLKPPPTPLPQDWEAFKVAMEQKYPDCVPLIRSWNSWESAERTLHAVRTDYRNWRNDRHENKAHEHPSPTGRPHGEPHRAAVAAQR
jgi:hypothetical protein